MRKLLGTSALALALIAVGAPAPLIAKDEPKEAPAGEAPGIPPALLALEKSIHPQTGDVVIPEAKAVLHLGDRYYFIPAAEAKRVLVEAWNNPPSAAEGVLGMVLEKDTTILNNVWGAIITFEDTGHVADSDAKSQDYAQVLKDRQEATESENENRKKAGYPAMHLIGWAQPPSYDPTTHSLIWAREIALDGDNDHGLNYDIRMLGRTGVLSLNMLTSMSALDNVRTAAQTFGKSVTFQPGSAYADFNASTDKTAEYGLAGLVGGGAVYAAAKLGFFAVLLKFAKFIIIGIVAFGAAILAFFRRMFGRKGADI